MLQVGDLILVRGHLRSPVDDILKVGQYLESHRPWRDEYSHVAIYLGGGLVAEAQGGRKSGIAPLSTYEGDYDIGHTHLTAWQQVMLRDTVDAELNLPYDWLAIFYIAWSIITGQDHHYIERKRRYCATFVNNAMKALGVPLVDKTLPTVVDLAFSPRVEIERL
jgi:hypothetical protein